MPCWQWPGAVAHPLGNRTNRLQVGSRRRGEQGDGMRRSLMDILACPVCKSSLELHATEETEDEIVSGTLLCSQCNEEYPIEDSIPNLLPPSLRA